MSTIHTVRVIKADTKTEGGLVLTLVTKEGENFSYTMDKEQVSDVANLLIFGFGFELEQKPHISPDAYAVRVDPNAMIGLECLAKFENGKWMLGYFKSISEDRVSIEVAYREHLKRRRMRRRLRRRWN
jgi:hypothetical protein